LQVAEVVSIIRREMIYWFWMTAWKGC